MKRTAFLLTVLLGFGAFSAWAAEEQEPADELRLLRAENNLLKASVAQRDKTIEVLKKEIESLKAEPAQVELEKLRKELAEAGARVEQLSKELEQAKPVKKKEAEDDKPPVTMKAVAEMNAAQLRELPSARVFGRGIVASIKPEPGGIYRVVAIDMSGEQRMPIGSRSLATAHWIKNRWVQIRCVFQVPEDTALRLQAGITDGSELNIAGKIKEVKVEPATKDTMEVRHLDLENVRAR